MSKMHIPQWVVPSAVMGHLLNHNGRRATRQRVRNQALGILDVTHRLQNQKVSAIGKCSFSVRLSKSKHKNSALEAICVATTT